jgi:type VI secretion system protein ImpF
MARQAANDLPSLSLLDRLIDLEPEKDVEATLGRAELVRRTRERVRRDLESLLNTRLRCEPLPEGLEALADSVFNFGVPDNSGASLASPDERESLAAIIEQVIRRHEPRFSRLRVTVADPGRAERTLHFRIEAILNVRPEVRPIVFDSNLEPVSGSFQLKESRGG